MLKGLAPPALLLLAILVSAVLSPARASPGADEEYLYEVWQREEGLPQVSVFSVVQDHRGYLWLGTEEGLVRFDGVRFRVFDRSNTPELRSQVIQALAPDATGLWIGTANGLNRYEDGRFRLWTTDDGLPDPRIRTIHLDRTGELWIGTLSGLSRFDGSRFTHYTAEDGLGEEPIEAIYSDRQGCLWIGTDGGGLSCLEDGRFLHYGLREGLSDAKVFAVYEDRQHRLWIGTNSGVDLFEDGGFLHYGPGEGLLHPTVRALYEDRRGHLWIGTNGGLYRFADGTVVAYGLGEDVVRSIWEDLEGGLWIGTRTNGLARLRESKFRTLGAPEGLLDDIVWTILEDRSGTVWMGTKGGLSRLDPDGSLKGYTTRDGLPGNDVRSLLEDRQEALWIGTAAWGVARLANGKIRTYTTADGLGAPGVRAIEEDRQGHVWFGTHGGGLSRVKDGEFRTYTTADGLSNDRIGALYADSRDVLWIGTDDGLTRYEDGTFRVFTVEDGLPHHRIYHLHEDAKGALWIGTAEGGLSRFKDGRFVNYSVQDGLFDHRVYRALDDGAGWMWMTSNKGIFRVRTDDLEAFAAGRIGRITSVTYDEADGLRSSECNGGTQPAGYKSRDGRLWFPTIRGVAILDPGKIELNAAPPVVIEEVRVDQQPIPIAERAVLSPGTREIDFRYTALSFVHSEKIQFRHRLEGFADDWVEAGESRSVRYTNLDPGTYRFQVVARNADGVWNETGETFDFELRRAFYETWYFYVLCALGAVLIGRGMYRLRVRQLLRRNQELLAIQSELEARNIELERFTYTVSHDLKSPLFTIHGFLGLLEKDTASGNREGQKDAVERIRHAAGSMQGLLEGLLEFSRVGRLVDAAQEVAFRELVDEAIEHLAEPLAEQGVEVVVASELPVVHGDRARLYEVVLYLIENALRYRDPEKAEPLVEITSERRGEHNAIVVRDNGLGIDPRYHEKIFGLFEKLDATSDGYGTGLALARRIVGLHGGRIWVESEGPGKGSAFVFTLPARFDRHGSAGQQSTPRHDLHKGAS